MVAVSQTSSGGAGETRELFGTRLGFVLAAVGSAVGLGNMWRFPYQAAEGGGAAFVAAYIAMTFLIGVPMILAEFAVGRRARLSAFGAVKAIGGRAWTPFGLLLVVTPLLILAYLSVVTGWALRYALDAVLHGFPPAPGERFAAVASGGSAILFFAVSLVATIGIVVFGVRKGIERASLLLVPILFLLLIGLAIWAATLPNATAGYRFYLAPSMEAVLNPGVLRAAAAQAFYSLSVGMGIMITYASYYSRDENLNREAAVIALSDFSVAFIGGLVVFPIVFALGLSGEIGESTLGALFISLPGAFLQMGAVGRIVGTAFFVALVVAAITSAVSLLEVISAALMDQAGLGRRSATMAAGLVAGVVGLLPAISLSNLALMDQIAAELFTVLGVLGTAVLVGWAMKRPDEELLRGASPSFARIVPIALFLVRFVVPVLLAWIAWLSLRETIDVVFGP